MEKIIRLSSKTLVRIYLQDGIPMTEMYHLYGEAQSLSPESQKELLHILMAVKAFEIDNDADTDSPDSGETAQ